MAFSHPELLIPSIIALICVLYPLPWHLRNRNVATLSMIFWMTSLNLVHIVNSIVWANDVQVRSPAWCDFSVLINMMYNYGLPLSHLILSRQIEGCTSLRMDSPLYSSITRRRGEIIDLALALVGPVVGFLVSLSARASRFDVLEAYGPMPGVYWDTWGIVWIAVVPMSIAALCLVYTSCYNIHKRRREMLSIISSNSSVGKTDFIRLLVLAIAELGTCMLRAAFNMTWGTRGLARLAAASPEDRAIRSMTTIRTFPLEQFTKTGRVTQDLAWFTVVACSFVFFLCFATSHEVKRFYWGVLETIIPPLKARRLARERQQGDRSPYASFPSASTTAASGANGNGADGDRKDLSFTELLTIDRRGSETSGASKVALA